MAPHEGSYDSTNPQSFNRYAYVQGDPVNFVDPTGLEDCGNQTPCVIRIGPDPIPPGAAGLIMWLYLGGGRDGRSGIGLPRMYRVEPADRPEKTAGTSEGKKNNPQRGFMGGSNATDACVAAVIGRYLGHEALTMLKQTALNAGIGLAALGSRFFFIHGITGTIAADSAVEIGLQMFVKGDSLSRAGQFAIAGAWAGLKLYPKLIRESFNNKKEAVRALRACYD